MSCGCVLRWVVISASVGIGSLAQAGSTLSFHGSSGIGSVPSIEVKGTPGQPAALFLSLGFVDPPLVLGGPYGGKLYLDLAGFWFSLSLPNLPPSGVFAFPLPIPNDPLLLGFTIHFQAFAPNLSNPVSIALHAPDTVLTVGAANDQLGSNFAVGDFDNDGVRDLAATAIEGGGGAGVIQIFRNVGGNLVHHSTVSDPTPQAGADFGSVVLAGDFVGDPTDDLLISVPFAGAAAADNSGEVILVDGATRIATHTILSPTGQIGTGFGTGLATGDFNADGFLDAAAGAPGTKINGIPLVGAVHILLGPTFTASQQLVVTPLKANGLFGAMMTAGDQNLDGKDDLLIGSPSAPQGPIIGAGEGFLFRAPFGAPSVKYLDSFPTPSSAYACRTVLADLGGGPELDVVLGTPGGFGSLTGNPSGISQIGEMQLYTDGIAANLRLFEDPTPEFFQHYAMDVQVGDVNGDGHLDILSAAFLADVAGQADAGEVFVYLGPTHNQVLEFSAATPQAGQQFGVFCALIDLDSDGSDEIVVGAPYQSPGGSTFQGALHVIR
jgi:FG-GAP repeat